MFYERSAVAEADRQLLRDFHQTIAQKEDDARITISELYQNCSVAVMFGSWKNISGISSIAKYLKNTMRFILNIFRL